MPGGSFVPRVFAGGSDEGSGYPELGGVSMVAARETGKKIAGTLRHPSGAIMALGPLAFLGGLSLWILIPVLLIIFAVGWTILWNLIPFFVSGIVMFITYYLLRHIKMKEPWLHVLPIFFGAIALLPVLIDAVRETAVSSAGAVAATSTQAVQAQGFLEGALDLLVKGPMFIAAIVFLVFIAIGLKCLMNLGSPGAFFAGFLGIALGLGLAFNAVGMAGMGLAYPGSDVSCQITTTEGIPAEISGATEIRGTVGSLDFVFEISGVSFVSEEFLKTEELPGGYKDYWLQQYEVMAELRVSRDAAFYRQAAQLTATFGVTHQKTNYNVTLIKSDEQESTNNTRIEETEEAPANNTFKLNLYGYPNGAWLGWPAGSAKNKITLWAEGYETRPLGEDRREEQEKPFDVGGVPVWVWIVTGCSVVPAGLVYVGKSKEWF